MGLDAFGSILRVDEIPRHPEVNQENQTALEPNNQILAAPANGGHALAREFRSHLRRFSRARQPRVENLDILEPAADELGLETCPYGLDFGQLGHRVSSLAPGIE